MLKISTRNIIFLGGYTPNNWILFSSFRGNMGNFYCSFSNNLLHLAKEDLELSHFIQNSL